MFTKVYDINHHLDGFYHLTHKQSIEHREFKTKDVARFYGCNEKL